MGLTKLEKFDRLSMMASFQRDRSVRLRQQTPTMAVAQLQRRLAPSRVGAPAEACIYVYLCAGVLTTAVKSDLRLDPSRKSACISRCWIRMHMLLQLMARSSTLSFCSWTQSC